MRAHSRRFIPLILITLACLFTAHAAPEVLIRPASSSPAPATTSSKSQPALTNNTIESAILRVFKIHRARLVLETNLPMVHYDFFISAPSQFPSNSAPIIETLFTEALRTNFNLTVTRETRPLDLLVLKTNFSTTEKLAHSSNNGKPELFNYKSVTGIHRPLRDLADGLENASGHVILDDTGLTNRYSFNLEWHQRDYEHPNSYGMTAALETLGLELHPQQRPVELLIVRPAAK